MMRCSLYGLFYPAGIAAGQPGIPVCYRRIGDPVYPFVVQRLEPDLPRWCTLDVATDDQLVAYEQLSREDRLRLLAYLVGR